MPKPRYALKENKEWPDEVGEKKRKVSTEEDLGRTPSKIPRKPLAEISNRISPSNKVLHQSKAKETRSVHKSILPSAQGKEISGEKPPQSQPNTTDIADTGDQCLDGEVLSKDPPKSLNRSDRKKWLCNLHGIQGASARQRKDRLLLSIMSTKSAIELSVYWNQVDQTVSDEDPELYIRVKEMVFDDSLNPYAILEKSGIPTFKISFLDLICANDTLFSYVACEPQKAVVVKRTEQVLKEVVFRCKRSLSRGAKGAFRFSNNGCISAELKAFISNERGEELMEQSIEASESILDSFEDCAKKILTASLSESRDSYIGQFVSLFSAKKIYDFFMSCTTSMKSLRERIFGGTRNADLRSKKIQQAFLVLVSECRIRSQKKFMNIAVLMAFLSKANKLFPLRLLKKCRLVASDTSLLKYLNEATTLQREQRKEPDQNGIVTKFLYVVDSDNVDTKSSHDTFWSISREEANIARILLLSGAAKTDTIFSWKDRDPGTITGKTYFYGSNHGADKSVRIQSQRIVDNNCFLKNIAQTDERRRLSVSSQEMKEEVYTKCWISCLVLDISKQSLHTLRSNGRKLGMSESSLKLCERTLEKIEKSKNGEMYAEDFTEQSREVVREKLPALLTLLLKRSQMSKEDQSKNIEDVYKLLKGDFVENGDYIGINQGDGLTHKRFEQVRDLFREKMTIGSVKDRTEAKEMFEFTSSLLNVPGDFHTLMMLVEMMHSIFDISGILQAVPLSCGLRGRFSAKDTKKRFRSSFENIEIAVHSRITAILLEVLEQESASESNVAWLDGDHFELEKFFPHFESCLGFCTKPSVTKEFDEQYQFYTVDFLSLGLLILGFRKAIRRMDSQALVLLSKSALPWCLGLGKRKKNYTHILSRGAEDFHFLQGSQIWDFYMRRRLNQDRKGGPGQGRDEVIEARIKVLKGFLSLQSKDMIDLLIPHIDFLIELQRAFEPIFLINAGRQRQKEDKMVKRIIRATRLWLVSGATTIPKIHESIGRPTYVSLTKTFVTAAEDNGNAYQEGASFSRNGIQYRTGRIILDKSGTTKVICWSIQAEGASQMVILNLRELASYNLKFQLCSRCKARSNKLSIRTKLCVKCLCCNVCVKNRKVRSNALTKEDLDRLECSRLIFGSKNFCSTCCPQTDGQVDHESLAIRFRRELGEVRKLRRTYEEYSCDAEEDSEHLESHGNSEEECEWQTESEDGEDDSESDVESKSDESESDDNERESESETEAEQTESASSEAGEGEAKIRRNRSSIPPSAIAPQPHNGWFTKKIKVSHSREEIILESVFRIGLAKLCSVSNTLPSHVSGRIALIVADNENTRAAYLSVSLMAKSERESCTFEVDVTSILERARENLKIELSKIREMRISFLYDLEIEEYEKAFWLINKGRNTGSSPYSEGSVLMTSSTGTSQEENSLESMVPSFPLLSTDWGMERENFELKKSISVNVSASRDCAMLDSPGHQCNDACSILIKTRTVANRKIKAEVRFWMKIFQLLFKACFSLEANYGQLASCVEILLFGKDTFVSLPCNSGKSLIFLFAAVILGKISVQVVATKAMEDQMEGECRKWGIRCVVVNRKNWSQIKAIFENQSHENVVLIASPENVDIYLDKYLQDHTHSSKFSLVGVDEAHLLLQWRFRPAFQHLGGWGTGLGFTVVAFSATATRDDQVQTMSMLRGGPSRFSTVCGVPVGYNIQHFFIRRPPKRDIYHQIANLCVQKDIGVAGMVHFETISGCKKFQENFFGFAREEYPTFRIACLLYHGELGREMQKAVLRSVERACERNLHFQLSSCLQLCNSYSDQVKVFRFNVESTDLSTSWVVPGEKVEVGGVSGTLLYIEPRTGQMVVEFNGIEEIKAKEVSKATSLTLCRIGSHFGCIVVATTALCTGVHIPNLDFVVSIDLPPSIADLIQLSNRAGRGGKQAISVTYYSLESYLLQRKRISDCEASLEGKERTDAEKDLDKRLTDRSYMELLKLGILMTHTNSCVVNQMNLAIMECPSLIWKCNENRQCSHCLSRDFQPRPNAIAGNTFANLGEIRNKVQELLSNEKEYTIESLIEAVRPTEKRSVLLYVLKAQIEYWILQDFIRVRYESRPCEIPGRTKLVRYLKLTVAGVKFWQVWPLLQPNFLCSVMPGWHQSPKEPAPENLSVMDELSHEENYTAS